VTTRLSPARDRFVVHVSAERAAQVEKALGTAGRVEDLLEGGLRVVQLAAEGAEDVESTWDRLRAAVGPEGWVSPVLVDAVNEPHYPTGDVTVRFAHEPPDTELEAFAADHQLRVKARNAFVRQQVTFEPVDRSRTYLPGLVARLAEANGVRTAWANTRSAYRRTSRD
jgi:hypothetical protein